MCNAAKHQVLTRAIRRPHSSPTGRPDQVPLITLQCISLQSSYESSCTHENGQALYLPIMNSPNCLLLLHSMLSVAFTLQPQQFPIVNFVANRCHWSHELEDTLQVSDLAYSGDPYKIPYNYAALIQGGMKYIYCQAGCRRIVCQ